MWGESSEDWEWRRVVSVWGKGEECGGSDEYGERVVRIESGGWWLVCGGRVRSVGRG